RVLPVAHSTRSRASMSGVSRYAARSLVRASAIRLSRRISLTLLDQFGKKCSLVIGDQRIDQFIQIAFHDPVELVERQVDTVIGNATLREIIGADTLGTIARTNLAAPRFRPFGFGLLTLHVIKARAQDLNGAGA